jgi:hemerythrin
MSAVGSDNLVSGSDEIDKQHKELITRANGLLATFENDGMNRQEISRTISYLADYVVYHFGIEEKVMDRFGYSSASQHKAQHAQFVKFLLKLKDRMLLEGINQQIGEEMRELVEQWLVNHIKFSDRALGMYLKHKVKPA